MIVIGLLTIFQEPVQAGIGLITFPEYVGEPTMDTLKLKRSVAASIVQPTASLREV